MGEAKYMYVHAFRTYIPYPYVRVYIQLYTHIYIYIYTHIYIYIMYIYIHLAKHTAERFGEARANFCLRVILFEPRSKPSCSFFSKGDAQRTSRKQNPFVSKHV